MSNSTEEAKRQAQRQQHRKDHFTDADRAFDGKGLKDRRAGRQENFNAQGNKSAADFNFDQHGKGHISGHEIRHLINQGNSREDVMSAAKASGGELGGRVQIKFARWDQEASTAAEANKLKDSYIDTIRPGSTSQQDVGIKNTQTQQINQDNDQTSTSTGDNNTVWQQQDNSIRQYGGDNRSFVYQGGNSGVDTPVSAATMSGYYDVDDSPAAQAKFHDLHTTLNDDYQKKYTGSGMRVAGMFSNFDARSFNPANLEKDIDTSNQRSYDRSILEENDAYGDRDRYRGSLSDYKFGSEQRTVMDDKDDDDDD